MKSNVRINIAKQLHSHFFLFTSVLLPMRSVMANFWLKWGVPGVELGKLNRDTHTQGIVLCPSHGRGAVLAGVLMPASHGTGICFLA